jgi:hypothetical protein
MHIPTSIRAIFSLLTGWEELRISSTQSMLIHHHDAYQLPGELILDLKACELRWTRIPQIEVN